MEGLSIPNSRLIAGSDEACQSGCSCAGKAAAVSQVTVVNRSYLLNTRAEYKHQSPTLVILSAAKNLIPQHPNNPFLLVTQCHKKEVPLR